MSCPNFITQNNFPLYLFDDSDLEWWEAQDVVNDVQADMEAINDGLTFFRLTVRGGYYGGLQFYVDLTQCADNAGFTQDGAEYADNESTKYYLDMYLSVAKRKFQAEQRKVCRLLETISRKYGFERYFCCGIFSNGEAIYEKAQNTTRSRIREAASA